MQIHDLTQQTPTTNSQLIFDTGSATYKALVSDIAKCIIEQYNGSTIGGTAQTLAAAIGSATDKVNIVTGSGTIKTLAASDDLAALGDGHYRLSSDVPINAPSGLASSSKYGYVTIQHRGAAAYTYYEYVAGNGNGTSLEHFHGWKSTAAGTSITWIDLNGDTPKQFSGITSLSDIPLGSNGYVQLDASVSPIGQTTSFTYWCTGTHDRRSIIAIYGISNETKAYVNVMHNNDGVTWKGWKSITLT